jgi:hypothetical protein
VAGGEIDRGARARRAKAAVAQRGEDAVFGLLDGRIGQADEIDAWFADLAGVHLDVDGLRVDPLESGG